MKAYPTVALSDVRHVPDLAILQERFEAYLKVQAPTITPHRHIPDFTAANAVRIIGNPFEIHKKHYDEDSAFTRAVANEKKYARVGQVACHVLNARAGWNTFHYFEEPSNAEAFFEETFAINQEKYVLLNAHKRDGRDLVHEIIHDYHGPQGRFDWLMNEGFTDWFTVDFVNSSFGSAFSYEPARLYAGGRMVVNDLVHLVGAIRIATLFFGTERNPKFERFAKKTSETLFHLEQFNAEAEAFIAEYKVPPVPIWPVDTEDAAKHLVPNGEITKRLAFSVMVENLKRA